MSRSELWWLGGGALGIILIVLYELAWRYLRWECPDGWAHWRKECNGHWGDRSAAQADDAHAVGDPAGLRMPELGLPDQGAGAAHGERRRESSVSIWPDWHEDARVEAPTLVAAEDALDEAWAVELHEMNADHPVAIAADIRDQLAASIRDQLVRPVLDWDRMSWAERGQLEAWDWARRMDDEADAWVFRMVRERAEWRAGMGLAA